MLISDLKTKEVFPGFHGRFVHTGKTTIAFWEITKDATIPVHSHFHEQIMKVEEGKFELSLNGETKIYEPGTLLVIPGNVHHFGRAITPCKILDIFIPEREDYKF